MAKREQSLSPHGESVSSGGESDNISNGNEKSENSVSSITTSSYGSHGENSSSMKESDDMSHENEADAPGSKNEKDKMFVPVNQSTKVAKLPFWLEDLSSGSGFTTLPSKLFEDDIQHKLHTAVIYQPDGVLEQLYELVVEIQTQQSNEHEYQKTVQDYPYTEENAKASIIVNTGMKNTELGSMAGDSGFKSSGKSVDGGNSCSSMKPSSSSNISPGDSGSDKKGLTGGSSENFGATSSDKDSGSGGEGEKDSAISGSGGEGEKDSTNSGSSGEGGEKDSGGDSGESGQSKSTAASKTSSQTSSQTQKESSDSGQGSGQTNQKSSDENNASPSAVNQDGNSSGAGTGTDGSPPIGISPVPIVTAVPEAKPVEPSSSVVDPSGATAVPLPVPESSFARACAAFQHGQQMRRTGGYSGDVAMDITGGRMVKVADDEVDEFFNTLFTHQGEFDNSVASFESDFLL